MYCRTPGFNPKDTTTRSPISLCPWVAQYDTRIIHNHTLTNKQIARHKQFGIFSPIDKTKDTKEHSVKYPDYKYNGFKMKIGFPSRAECNTQFFAFYTDIVITRITSHLYANGTNFVWTCQSITATCHHYPGT